MMSEYYTGGIEMKKIISAILAAAMSLSCLLMNVHAESRTIDINAALSNPNEIHILYNDTVVRYDDVKPVNTEGRVMIPFRAALESMGAVVEYNADERLVTASRDGVTIKFTLLDDTIYINAGGEESTITMDVPMIIVNDRTLVPIRFMSNALGMQVGWDGGTETVVIMDYDKYFDDFSEIAPNITALSELDSPNLNKSSQAFEFSLSSNGEGEERAIALSGKVDAVKGGDASGVSAEVSVSGNLLSINNASFDAVYKDGVLYLNKDAITKIAGSTDNTAVKTAVAAATALASEDTWYSIDITKIFAAFLGDEKIGKMIGSALTTDTPDVETLVMSTVTTEGDAVFSEVMSLASMLDMYEVIDKYIKVTPKDNGYTVSVDVTPADCVEIINVALGGLMGEEDKAALAALYSCSLSASIENDGAKQTTDISAGIKSGTDDVSFKYSSEASTEANTAEITAPAQSVDITDLLFGN